jgi:hypothetical protein
MSRHADIWDGAAPTKIEAATHWSDGLAARKADRTASATAFVFRALTVTRLRLAVAGFAFPRGWRRILRQEPILRHEIDDLLRFVRIGSPPPDLLWRVIDVAPSIQCKGNEPSDHRTEIDRSLTLTNIRSPGRPSVSAIA